MRITPEMAALAEQMKGDTSGIRLGPGQLFVTYEGLLLQWKPFGLDESGFDALLGCLSVPVVTLPNGQRLVNLLSLQASMALVSRVGADDFDMRVDRIDEQEVHQNWKKILKQLHAVRAHSTMRVTAQARNDFEAALNQIALQLARVTGHGKAKN